MTVCLTGNITKTLSQAMFWKDLLPLWQKTCNLPSVRLETCQKQCFLSRTEINLRCGRPPHAKRGEYGMNMNNYIITVFHVFLFPDNPWKILEGGNFSAPGFWRFFCDPQKALVGAEGC